MVELIPDPSPSLITASTGSDGNTYVTVTCVVATDRGRYSDCMRAHDMIERCMFMLMMPICFHVRPYRSRSRRRSPPPPRHWRHADRFYEHATQVMMHASWFLQRKISGAKDSHGACTDSLDEVAPTVAEAELKAASCTASCVDCVDLVCSGDGQRYERGHGPCRDCCTRR